MRLVRIVCVWLLSSACDPAVVIEGTIAVPEAVLQKFSRERPGEVFLKVQTPDVAWPLFLDRWAVLCDLKGDALIIVRKIEIGSICPGNVTVTAWADYVDLDGGTQVKCDPSWWGPEHDDRAVRTLGPSATTVAVDVQSVPMKVTGQSFSSCGSGSGSVAMVLSDPAVTP